MQLALDKIKLTQEFVKHLFDYNPETGKLIWKNPNKSNFSNIKTGDNACCIHRKYYRVTIFRKKYAAHRIIWLYVYGYFPENDIDHIDRNGLNNKLSNLREVSRVCNMRNVGLRSNSHSGVTGVSFLKRDFRWYANITVKKKTHSLGTYDDYYDAVCARLAAEQCLNWYRCDRESPAYRCLMKSLNSLNG